MAENQDKTFVEFAQEQDRIIREASKQVFWRVQKEMKAVRELTEQLKKTKANEAALTATVKDLRAKLAQAVMKTKNDPEVAALKDELAKVKQTNAELKSKLDQMTTAKHVQSSVIMPVKRKAFTL